jgi:DNA polymerase/3'-5' exonuclease PolX
VIQTANKIFDKNINLKIETCGSFRRGNMECGDVDMLIT